MKKKLMAALMSVVVVASLVGCSQEQIDQAKDAANDIAGDEKVQEIVDEVKDAVEDAVNTATGSDKTWVIATDTAFKPFEYTDENGDFVGIDMDILAAIAEDQGFTYEVQVLGWDASIAACQAGQADGMIAGASITEERKSNGWIFSDGYYDANQCMAVKGDSTIASFEDLKGLSVAVKTGTMSAAYAEELAAQYDFTVTYFEDSPTMYQAVVGGQVAACFDDTPIMACNIKETGIDMKLVDGTGNDPAAYGLAIFNADNQELIDMFNAGLANIKANGKYDEIIAKYLG